MVSVPSYHRKVVTTYVDAAALDVNLPLEGEEDFSQIIPLAFNMLRFQETYYLSLPLILLKDRDFGPKFQPKEFQGKRGGSGTEALVPDMFRAEKDILKDISYGSSQKYYVVEKETKMVYFHPALLVPNGVVQKALTTFVRDFYTGNPKAKRILRPYFHFLQWLDNPNIDEDLGDGEAVVFGAELDCLSKVVEKYTQQCLDFNSRCAYLWDKGLTLKRPLAKNCREDARLGRITRYDEFALWYVKNHELPYVKYGLTKGQAAAYVQKRWLPWKKVSSLVPYTKDWDFSRRGKLMLKGLGEPVIKALLQDAQKFPAPFIVPGLKLD